MKKALSSIVSLMLAAIMLLPLATIGFATDEGIPVLGLSGTTEGARPTVLGLSGRLAEGFAATIPEGMDDFGQGMIIDNYYTYCIDSKKEWPKDGTLYAKGDPLELGERLRGIIGRCLNAGYPHDLYGFSRLAEGARPQDFARMTQNILWMAIDGEELRDDDPYLVALYRYAMLGELPQGYEQPLPDTVVTMPNDLTLAYNQATQRYEGVVTFQSNRLASLRLTSIPEGATVLNNGVELAENDLVFTDDHLLVTAPQGALTPTGELEFNYVYYEQVDLGSLHIYRPLETPIRPGAEYQRMAGYELAAIYDDIFASVTLTGNGQPEVPEDKPEVPEDKPEIPEDKPEIPEDKPEIPEDKPEIPEDRPNTPSQPGGDDSSDDNDSTTTVIPDAQIPLGNAGALLILDEQIPLGALPATGGSAVIKAGLLALVMGVLLKALKKNDQDSN